MRVFDVQQDGKFKEYIKVPFQAKHEEAVLEDWIEANPDSVLDDSRLLIIGRQVPTNLGGFIDLLGIDREGDITVIELKRDRTPRDTLAQALEYASYAEQLDADQLESVLRTYTNDESTNLSEHHRAYFQLTPDEAVSFNKEQRIVLVGQRMTPEIRQTSTYLSAKGIRVSCIEFNFFQTKEGTNILTQEIVVGQEVTRGSPVSTTSLPIVTEDGFMASVDDNGKPVFKAILEHAQDKQMPIHWGTKGFSLNVNLNGTHVAVCYGYPPTAVYRQSIYTALMGQGGLRKKTAATDEVIQSVAEAAASLGFFVPAVNEMRFLIDRKYSEQEIHQLILWIDRVADVIKTSGLRE